MKLLGIIWNPGIPYIKEIKGIIAKYGFIKEVIYINFESEFASFLNELYYDTTLGEEIKASQKISSLVNRYLRNDCYIILIDMPTSEQVYLAAKKKNMYENVLKMKMEVRKSYSFALNTPVYIDDKFDNIFHCSDDVEEYHFDLPIVLKYIVKRSAEIINIKLFIDTDKREKNGTRFNYWITNELFFKQEIPNTFEVFSEIFNMNYMRIMNLPTAEYYIACYDNYRGVCTKRLNTKDENLILLSDIMYENNIISKKNMIENNYIEQVIILLASYCDKHNFHLANDTRYILLKIYLYDLLFAQNDRNPTNIGLRVNKKTGFAELVCFDHSNMLFFDEPDKIKRYDNSKDCFLDLVNKTSKTFLLYNYKEFSFCFKSKFEHVEFFLNNAMETDKVIFYDLLNLYSPKLIEYVFAKMEKDNMCILDDTFKVAILEYYKKIKEILERV